MVWALPTAFVSAGYSHEFIHSGVLSDVTGSLEDDMYESTVDTADGISEFRQPQQHF